MIEIIKALPKLTCVLPEKIALDLHGMTNLFEQSWLDENSQYREQKKRLFTEPAPLRSDSGVSEEELEVEFARFRQRINDSLSHAKVLDFIKKILGNQTEVTSQELEISVTDDLLKLMLGVLKAGEPDVPYRVEFQEGYVTINGFRIPDLIIGREGGGADVV